VVVHVGHSGTVPAIKHAKYAQDVGADGVMAVLPYYHVPEEDGLYKHFEEIANSIEIGVSSYMMFVIWEATMDILGLRGGGMSCLCWT